MSDALNINVSEDSDGNGGVIKPIKANEPPDATLFSGDQKTVVGKIACNKYNVLYFFVSDSGGGDGIYAYDPMHTFLAAKAEEVYKVFSDEALEFDIGFVEADITYIQRSTVPKERITWTCPTSSSLTTSQSRRSSTS